MQMILLHDALEAATPDSITVLTRKEITLLADVCKKLRKLPAMDVVLCKDCDNFIADENIVPNTGTCKYCEMVRKFDDFCSYGECKEEI